MVGVFGDPQLPEKRGVCTGFFEPRDQLVDIPFGCGDLVFVFREVHPAAIQFAPVFLVAHGFGKSQHDLMPERRFADLCDLLADASVQRGKRLALVEDAVQEPLPFGFAGKFFLIPDGVAAARAVFEFEEQESVEKPMFRTVEESVYDVGAEFVDRPVQPVFPALIDQREVLNVGRLVVLCGGSSELPANSTKHTENAKYLKAFITILNVEFYFRSGFPVTNDRIRGRVPCPSLPETPTGRRTRWFRGSNSAAVCRRFPPIWRWIYISRKRFCTRRSWVFLPAALSSNSNSIARLLALISEKKRGRGCSFFIVPEMVGLHVGVVDTEIGPLVIS